MSAQFAENVANVGPKKESPALRDEHARVFFVYRPDFLRNQLGYRLHYLVGRLARHELVSLVDASRSFVVEPHRKRVGLPNDLRNE